MLHKNRPMPDRLAYLSQRFATPGGKGIASPAPAGAATQTVPADKPGKALEEGSRHG